MSMPTVFEHGALPRWAISGTSVVLGSSHAAILFVAFIAALSSAPSVPASEDGTRPDAAARPLRLRLLGEAPSPRPGEAFEATIEVQYRPWAPPRDLEVFGNGWTVYGAETSRAQSQPPRPSRRESPWESLRLAIVAVPEDPDEPLRLRCLVGGEALEIPMDLSPRRLEAERRGGRLVPCTAAAEPLAPHRVAELEGPPVEASPSGAARTDGDGSSPPLEIEAGSGGAAREIRVRGRMVYRRVVGGQLEASAIGVDSATVEVFDSDVTFDEKLVETRTNPDGYYDVTFTWDPGIFGDQNPDLYVRMVSRNGAVVVEKEFWDDPFLRDYKWSSATVDDFRGTERDFGTLEPESNRPALHILTNITRGWRWVRSTVGQSTGSVDVKWPCSFASHYEWEVEDICLNSDLKWAEVSILHEYGHHWMYRNGIMDKTLGISGTDATYCNGVCDGGAGCGHCLWCEESAIVAWQEGFCHWFADAIVRTLKPTYGVEPIQDGTDVKSIESVGNGSPDCSGPQDPGRTEGYVAALLRDIEDSGALNEPGDCLGLGPDEIIGIARRDPRAIHEFLTMFVGTYPSYHALLWDTAAAIGSFRLDPPPASSSTTFADAFSRPDGKPTGWTRTSGLWRIEGGALTIDTGSRPLPQVSASRVTLASRTPESLDVLSVNTAGQLLHYYRGPDLLWDGANVSEALGFAGRAAALSAIAQSPGSLEVIGAYGQGQSLCHYRWTEAAGWSARDLLATAPLREYGIEPRFTVRQRPDGTIDVFGRKYPGLLVHWWWTEATGWRAENVSSAIPGGTTDLKYRIGGVPTGLVRSNDILEVYALNGDGDLLHFRWTAAGGWTAEDVTLDVPGIGETFRAHVDQDEEVALAYVPASFPAPSVVEIFLRAREVDFFTSLRDLLRYRWSSGKTGGWVAESLTALPAIGEGFRITGRPVLAAGVGAGPNDLDVLALGGTSLIHYARPAGGAWFAEDVSRAAGTPTRPFLGISADPVIADAKEGILDVYALDGSRYLNRFQWQGLGGWSGEAVTALPHIGFDYRLYRYFDGLSPDGGSIDILGAGMDMKSLIHYGWSDAEGWVAENLTGDPGGVEAHLWAGAPAAGLRGIRAIELAVEFLEEPADGIGRHGGVFFFARAPVSRWENSGYGIDWIDRPADRGFRLSRWDCGVQTLLARAGAGAGPGRTWRIEIGPASISLSADCRKVLEARDATYREGHFGLWAYLNGQRIRFDDVKVLSTELPPCETVAFRRGDSNDDGVVDISDGIFTLNFLFVGGKAPICLKAADANDDAAVDISDGIFTLSYLFTGGGRPPAPGPDACGGDPTPDALPCGRPRTCP